MSLQMETPNAGGIASFWSNFRRARSSPAAPPLPTPAAPVGRDPAVNCDRLPPRAQNLARTQIAARRPLLQAEALANMYIKSLAPMDVAYRKLKDEFDELCEQAEIAPVSDKRFAGWLSGHGARRYREGFPKVTMYKIAPRQMAAAA